LTVAASDTNLNSDKELRHTQSADLIGEKNLNLPSSKNGKPAVTQEMSVIPEILNQ
jgi:hypothetical protein